MKLIVSVPYWGSNYLIVQPDDGIIGYNVSVPYWGSNYLIITITIMLAGLCVSVPYWGSNYLMQARGINGTFFARFRPLLGF